MTVPSSNAERREPVAAASVRIRARGQKLTDDVDMIVLCREHERRAHLAVPRVGICPMREVDADDLVLAGVGRVDEGGVAGVVVRLDRDALLDKPGEASRSPPWAAAISGVAPPGSRSVAVDAELVPSWASRRAVITSWAA